MKASEIQVGHYYVAKVSNKLVDVRVDEIEDVRMYYHSKGGRRYHCTNKATGRKVMFRSAAKFRSKSNRPSNAEQMEIDKRMVAKVQEINQRLLNSPIPQGEASINERLAAIPVTMTGTAVSHEQVEGRGERLLCPICKAVAYPTPTGYQCAAYSNHKGSLDSLSENIKDMTVCPVCDTCYDANTHRVVCPHPERPERLVNK